MKGIGIEYANCAKCKSAYFVVFFAFLYPLICSEFDENDPEFNLEAIVRMQFQKYAEEIMDISYAATMELQIEMGLRTINETWQTMAFELAPYKDDIYRIKGVDDCFTALEENSVQISSMKSTRFVEPFSKEVDYWEKTLNYILETLENSLMVQRQWLYLENIFQGEDIRKQMPVETNRFEELTDGNAYNLYNMQIIKKNTHISIQIGKISQRICFMQKMLWMPLIISPQIICSTN